MDNFQSFRPKNFKQLILNINFKNTFAQGKHTLEHSKNCNFKFWVQNVLSWVRNVRVRIVLVQNVLVRNVRVRNVLHPTTDVWIQNLNLKLSDGITILYDELNDGCINAVSNLLKKQFPNKKGHLQPTLVLHNTEHCEHIGLNYGSVQVIYQSSRKHGIACAVKQQEVYICDSMYV